VTVKALIVNHVDGIGIAISGLRGKVIGSYIGTNNTGATAVANTSDGIVVAGSNATIGGTTATERNVISGNTGNGIFICSCANATIQGNYIGTDVSGTAPVGNGQYGVQVADAVGVTIGGTTPTARNVISANTSGGINAYSGSKANLNLTIAGNYIGTV
jgi:hypothetical protein